MSTTVEESSSVPPVHEATNDEAANNHNEASSPTKEEEAPANHPNLPVADAAPRPAAAQPPEQQTGGIVSSENSVASNSTGTNGSTKLLSSAASSSSNATTATANNPDDNEDTAAVEPPLPQHPTPTNNAMLLKMTAPPHFPVAEFLFQLTKMLTDENKEFIEWKGSSIVVHDPPGLEKLILPKYFRHSNYSSFQRQMNYFGFRKIAGKGKMAACSYINENATEDISSLLYIKRKKTGVSSSAAKLLAQANKLNRQYGNALDHVQQQQQHQQQQANINQMMMLQNPMMGMNPKGGIMQNPMSLGTAMGMNPQVMQNPMMNMGTFNPMTLMQQQQQQVMMGAAAGLQNHHGMNTAAVQASMNLQGLPPHNTTVMGNANNHTMNLNNMLPGNNAKLLRDQQQGFLAQLQQAHASATSGQGSMMQPNKVFPSGAGTAPILTNDQGNLYNLGQGCGGTHPQAQALLMQQAAAMGGLSFPNTTQGGMVQKEDGDDKGSDFRSFLNQQISLFSDGNSGPHTASTAASAGRPSVPQGHMNLPQGLSYEQFFQLNGMAKGGVNASSSGGEQFLPRNV